MNKSLELWPAQMEFFESEFLFTLFCGGLGSGKTFTGAVWAITMALKYPDAQGLITANSYSQLRKATMTEMFKILDRLGISYRYKQNESEVIINGKTRIFMLSMEKYDLLRGIEVGWCWSDECAFYRLEAFQVLIGRIRDKRGPCQWKGTTTPNGYNWLYDKFVQDPIPNSSIVYSKTADNIEYLGEAYIENLRAQYDSRLAEQELDGRFVNLNSGLVYYTFDRRKHCTVMPRTMGHSVLVGMDFNVHPMTAVYGFVHREGIHIFGELYQENSDTFKAAKEIINTFPGEWVKVIPDDTGRRRQTSSSPGKTDHEILRRAGLDVVKFINPGVRDRYNNVNRLFEKGVLTIDPKCKMLIKDLEQLSHDNPDAMLSHISDSLGYLCWYVDALKRPRIQPSVQAI